MTSRPSRVAAAVMLAAVVAAAGACSGRGAAGGDAQAAPVETDAETVPRAASTPSRPTPSAAPLALAPPAAAAADSATAAREASAAAAGDQGASSSREAFAALVTRLSEPDGPFFSDNYVSNETSYLQVAAELARDARPGGAFVGVGPEQNFTYIAISKPSVAFVVDIRRANMLLHLLYKAMFEEATTRSHFVALLLGRPYEPAGDRGPGATIEQVLEHAQRLPAAEASFVPIHARLHAYVSGLGVRLSTADHETLEATHRAFFAKQLDLRFELKQRGGRKYPTLRELLAQADPGGDHGGFLASEEAFRFVQRMQREDRVVPVVGTFAGDRAMSGVAAEIARRGAVVSVLYVSNVEQYLFEPGVWAKWTRNVAELPTDEASLFVRAYLDQGRRHPRQLAGHRTATVLQRIRAFADRQARAPYESYWAVATDQPPGRGSSR